MEYVTACEPIANQDPLPIGKYRRLSRLSDMEGRFAMLAIDQRGSLQGMIGSRQGTAADAISNRDLAAVKRAVTTAIAPLATAVLTDPLCGYPGSIDVIPPHVGILLAIEVTGYEAVNESERLSRIIEGWSVDETQRVGADAVKLLLWHNPDASEATQQHQREIVRSVGEACARTEMPFVLEIVTYSLDRSSAKGAGFARIKPDLVVDAASTYSHSDFQVDLLKLEFPADLKFTEEFQNREFGKGEVVYDLAAVEDACSRLDSAAGVPWIILSAGVNPEEFVENVRLSNAAGASGFLCGRAVWKHVVDHFPSDADMLAFMENAGRSHFELIREANRDALPWFQHRRFESAVLDSKLSL